MSRTVGRIINGRETSDGEGVKLKRTIGGQLEVLDPFLLLDEFKSDERNDYIGGFPSHPHRGFETVTIMFNGYMEHQDHKGNKGLLTPGSVQWMTAGKGIIHSEMPKQEDGLMHGCQLWLNLPREFKMMEPRYQDISPEKIPNIEENGNKIRIIAGEYKNITGPVEGVVTNPTLLDVELAPGQSFTEAIPIGHTAFVYVIRGSATFGQDDESKLVKSSQLAVLEDQDTRNNVQAVAGPEGVKFLLAAAKPIKEPIARYGPFVMNTQQEIQQAFRDYQSGKF
ncbi:hypothetical protein CYY_000587 [Polysphondylium violaceum]|uniref:Pirin family protein n=1 Tax=Polysphondylium violaceum TaxID=133409 RepID=A0A8J4QAQ6_9MYCE|nr:hypothetical protein CYY_000587 [Polysphondylium violaceum]